ncbi:hypothetical protein C8R43DRAFT_1132837 [Mycena crocata]|nr:hypothetical protein C8R43DRAFT_1132837 [Mycena crocata]
MRLPQELIYDLIDEIEASPDSGPSLRSSKSIFSRIQLKDDAPASPSQFRRLLSDSPHLALHVRSLETECHPTNWTDVGHILAAVINLTQLKLASKAAHWFIAHETAPIQAPFHEPFSFTNLHTVELCHYKFRDLLHLQSLFCNTAKLESLALERIVFSDSPTSAAAASCTTGKVTVSPKVTALSTLELRHLGSSTLECILNSSTVVDPKHLHMLVMHDALIAYPLRLNAHSIRNLRVCVYFLGTPNFPGRSRVNWFCLDLSVVVGQPLEPQVLTNLRFLTLEVYYPTFLPDLLRMIAVGNLRHLEVLVVFFGASSDYTYRHEDSWGTFDSLLRGLLEGENALKSVVVSIGHAEPRLRSWMPSLNDSGILRILTPVE